MQICKIKYTDTYIYKAEHYNILVCLYIYMFLCLHVCMFVDMSVC